MALWKLLLQIRQHSESSFFFFGLNAGVLEFEFWLNRWIIVLIKGDKNSLFCAHHTPPESLNVVIVKRKIVVNKSNSAISLKFVNWIDCTRIQLVIWKHSVKMKVTHIWIQFKYLLISIGLKSIEHLLKFSMFSTTPNSRNNLLDYYLFRIPLYRL